MSRSTSINTSPSVFASAMRHAGIGLTFIFLLACGREEVPQAPKYSEKPPVEDKKTHYVFAVHPLYNPQLLHQKYQPLMQYLNTRIPGYEFALDTSNDYADFERKLKEGKPHFALPNPYHAALARDWGYQVIAKMGNDDVFRGIFLVRNESTIKEPVDLRGKVISYPAATALAATMMPQLYLQKHGLDVETEVQNNYVGTHNSSIMNAYLGQSAAGATWPVAWQAFQKANPKEAGELHVIWETPKLIQNAIIARTDLPSKLVDQVRHILTSLQETPDGREVLEGIDTASFVSANNQQFEVVIDFLKEFNAQVKKQR